jgi:hypothetical protein
MPKYRLQEFSIATGCDVLREGVHVLQLALRLECNTVQLIQTTATQLVPTLFNNVLCYIVVVHCFHNVEYKN